MFTAKWNERNRRINVLDPISEALRESLRAAARSGGLSCPHCGQEVLLRVGDIRRPHFAHKVLDDCPLHKESAEVTEAKARLYHWLRNQLAGRIELDARLISTDTEKPIFLDLLVETEAGKRFGYWVFDRERRDRNRLMDAAKADGISPLVIHTDTVLKHHSKDRLILSKTLRDLIAHSVYDQGFVSKRGGHLHFLDGDGILKTFRRLTRVHRPNLYSRDVLRESPLEEARFDPQTGELAHEADVAERLEWIQSEEERKRKREEGLKAVKHRFGKPARPAGGGKPWKEKGPVGAGAASPAAGKPSSVYPKSKVPAYKVREPHESSVNRYNQPYPCEVCGETTLDWVELRPSRNTCVCRACNQKRQKGGTDL